MKRCLLSLALPLVLCACGSLPTYSGPRKGAGEVAQIVPENAWNRARESSLLNPARGSGEVRVRVDGHSLGGTDSRFSVLPGRHDLQVAYLNDETPLPEKLLRTRAVTLSLQALAGHVYGIRGEATWVAGRARVRLWAVDGADGRSVASVDVPASHVFYEEGPLLPAELSD